MFGGMAEILVLMSRGWGGFLYSEVQDITGNVHMGTPYEQTEWQTYDSKHYFLHWRQVKTMDEMLLCKAFWYLLSLSLLKWLRQLRMFLALVQRLPSFHWFNARVFQCWAIEIAEIMEQIKYSTMTFEGLIRSFILAPWANFYDHLHNTKWSTIRWIGA